VLCAPIKTPTQRDKDQKTYNKDIQMEILAPKQEKHVEPIFPEWSVGPSLVASMYDTMIDRGFVPFGLCVLCNTNILLF
jgi:hypothetical protein